jgi:hypothetical protein
MISGALVSQSSYSAFNATTANPANNWAAGSVVLADDDGGSTAMFNAVNLKPGSTGSKCIVVTSSGTLASAVKLYATGYNTTTAATVAFGTYLDLVIDDVTDGTFASTSAECLALAPIGTNDFTGTLASFASSKTNFGNGVSDWAPAAGSVSRTYRVTYTLNASTPNTAQLGNAQVGFTWEAQNS